jgi:hypothetical protein
MERIRKTAPILRLVGDDHPTHPTASPTGRNAAVCGPGSSPLANIVSGPYGDFTTGARDLQEVLRNFLMWAYAN